MLFFLLQEIYNDDSLMFNFSFSNANLVYGLSGMPLSVITIVDKFLWLHSEFQYTRNGNWKEH